LAEPDPRSVIEIHDAIDSLSTDLSAWATRTRFRARLTEREGV